MTVPLYEPLNCLKPVAEDIWIVDGEAINMNIKITSIPFSTRMTIIRLKDGSLFCHSPIQANNQLIEEIKKLGEVRHIISPNKLHYAFIPQWQKEFPEAITWASPGVRERANKQGVVIHFDQNLEDAPAKEWEMEIDQLIFNGSLSSKKLYSFIRKVVR